MYNGGHLRVTHRGQLAPSGAGTGARTLGCMADPSERPSLFGSPSFPTPLDRVRSAKRERAAQLGLTSTPASGDVWLRRTHSNENEGVAGGGGAACASSSTAPRRSCAAAAMASPLRNVAAALASRAERAFPSSPRRTRPTRSSDDDDRGGGGGKRQQAAGARRGGVHCALEDFTAITEFVKLSIYLQTVRSELTFELSSGINDVSFSSVAPPPLTSLLLEGSQTLGDSWALYDYVQHASSRFCPASTVRNPNKALCTISARTSEILTANEMAVALFALSEEHLLGRRLSEFVKLKYKNTHVTESHLERQSGRLVEVSGRVLECIDSTGLHIPVSVWLTHLSSGKESGGKPGPDVKCLVALEPVERVTAMLLLAPPSSSSSFIKKASRSMEGKVEQEEGKEEGKDKEEDEEESWRVLSCDQQALGLFECAGPAELVDRPLDQFITGLEEMTSRSRRPGNANKKVKLSITGRTRLGKAFPCFAIVQRKSVSELSARADNPSYAQLLANLAEKADVGDPDNSPWLLTLWLFANISGLLTVCPADGRIHSCNDTLAQMLFGYSKSALVGQMITDIIPNFFCPEADAKRDDDGEEREEEEIEDDDIGQLPIDDSDIAQPHDSLQDTSELLAEARSLLADLTVSSGQADEAKGRLRESMDSSGSAAADSAIDCDPEWLLNSQQAQSTPVKSGTSTVKALSETELRSSGIPSSPPPAPPAPSSARTQPPSPFTVREGSYEGRGRHLDGSMLELIYAVRVVELLDSETGGTLAVVWVSRNPERQNFAPAFSISTSSPFWSREVSREPGHHVENFGGFVGDFSRGPFADRSWSYLSACSRSSFNAASFSPLPQSFPLSGPSFRSAPAASIAEEEPSPPRTPPIASTTSEAAAAEEENGARESNGSNGERPAEVVGIEPTGLPIDPLDRDYEPLGVIGKGAFGFVRLARCRRTRAEVVVKHIRKAKLQDGTQFAPDPTNPQSCIPREAALLLSLDHPNIVSVLACVEGRDCWHMVMPKHGQGMDLFEFIDRSPNLDEALVSYIFRQLVSAVHYLHRRGLVHRDIKDENIILDTQFNIKLIDFGAAARLEPGKMFRVFCGTLEFCSPEILLGNEYRGPEADVWSMGITLYTLMFGENPFFDHEETIHGVLKPPFRVSAKLIDLLSLMLATDPTLRADVATVRVHPWVTQFVDIEKYSFQAVLPNNEFVGNTGSDFRQYSTDVAPSQPPPPPLKPRRDLPTPRSHSDSGTALL